MNKKSPCLDSKTPRINCNKKVKVFMSFFFLGILLFSSHLFPIENNIGIEIRALAVQETDQKIVGAGFTTVDNVNKILIARYNTDGSLDTSFNTTGIVTTLLIGSACKAQALTIDSSSNILVAGSCDQQFCLGRFTPAGILDTTFNSPEGCVTTTIGDYAEVKTIQGDAFGNIITAGFSISSGVARSTLTRYSSTGTLDTSFGTNGVVTTLVGNRSLVESIAIQTDGKIVAAGWAGIYNSEHGYLIRYNADGSLDTSFGTAGIATTQVGLMSHAYSVALQSDGKLVTVGESQGKIIVIRYTSSGALDTTFGSSGIVTTDVDGNSATATTVKITSSGEILVSGFSQTNGFIIQYTTTGTLDPTFSTDGFVKERGQNFYALAIQADGKLAAIGTDRNGGIALFRYTQSGEPDTSFGSDGQASSPGVQGNSAMSVTTIWDERPQNVGGGTFEKETWQTRMLNKIKGNVSSVSLSNNRFTLQPGRYLIQIEAPGYKVGGHKCRLQNVTDNAIVQFGTTAEIQSTASANTTSKLLCYASLSYEKEFEVQHYASASRNGDGFGKSNNFPGASEIYTQVTIIKLPEN